ncbi:MAG TPA: TetR/AcrR family transcriptional regulator [Coriobacteriia bacterium]|nr:TetR/AcrR family transcriptional regulator [Coriobacteriia bacterium]
MSAAVDTGERIVEAAAQLFAERGYAATTTKAIAERAGVNEVTLFRRFENKAGVLKALGARFAEASSARAVHQLSSTDDAHATLLALARNEVATSIASGGVALRLAFDAASVPEVAELMGEGPGSNVEAMAGYMAERQAAGQLRDDIAPEVLAEAFATLTSSFVMYRMIMGFLPKPEDALSDKIVEQLFDIFWSGAAAKKSGNHGAKRERSKR